MCIGLPGRITNVCKGIAEVDYFGKKIESKIIEGDYKVGDYVIVQGGFVIEKIPTKTAENQLREFQR